MLQDDISRALALAGLESSDFDLTVSQSDDEPRELRPAAVLISIEVFETEPQLILTKRSSALRHHPGQIAFPGGKVDETDVGAIDAALREAREEIGLDTEFVSIIGTLPAHVTVTGFSVTPVIAIVHQPFATRVEVGEVAEVFRVPLSHVLDLGHYKVQERRWCGSQRGYYTVPYGPYYIWGATARILYAFATRMVHP